MAPTGYGCVFGECQRPVAVIITWLTTGNTISLCAEDFGPGMIPLLAAELGVEPGPFYASIEKYQAREVKKAERAQADAHADQAAEGSKGPQPPAGDGRQDDDGQDDSAAALPMDNGSRVVTEP